jgi:hypothetical protein
MREPPRIALRIYSSHARFREALRGEILPTNSQTPIWEDWRFAGEVNPVGSQMGV